jgi:ring-1,2-phenylacetyl-CoA epoxidase subunit PaaD
MRAGDPSVAPSAHGPSAPADRNADKPTTDTKIGSNRDADLLVKVWAALGNVVDPEIPIVSIVELGIVRSVRREDGCLSITVTPTYSGCPATRVIESDIREAVKASVGEEPRIVTVLAPPWTTDWIAPEALRKLHDAGIAPPATAQPGVSTVNFVRGRASVQCPNCGSYRTSELARFGSTACKAQYRCADCLEPFDYFKPH